MSALRLYGVGWRLGAYIDSQVATSMGGRVKSSKATRYKQGEVATMTVWTCIQYDIVVFKNTAQELSDKRKPPQREPQFHLAS
jgi:hypothetical protein